ncbi:hypothetical protein R1flu_004819 [Riccia fluitans]|uniref:Uncharacterized protein n=1 Tax=Riccia fluitans TaxID=41844 RepID=A0ABD1YS79_9MARC
MVLFKLSIFSQIRAKAVRKRGNQLIKSHLLSASAKPIHHSGATRTVPIYFSHGQLIVFDQRKNRWQEQCLDPTNSLSLLASAGGLLCFKTNTTGNVIICSPITMHCKLPEPFDPQAITDPLHDLLKPVVTLEGGKEAIEAFQRSF